MYTQAFSLQKYSHAHSRRALRREKAAKLRRRGGVQDHGTVKARAGKKSGSFELNEQA